MASLIHIAEIAAILAVAYMLGWAVGYAAHRLLAPKPVVVAAAAIPEARLAAVTGATDALVKAPVIAPVADPAAEPAAVVPPAVEAAEAIVVQASEPAAAPPPAGPQIESPIDEPVAPAVETPPAPVAEPGPSPSEPSAPPTAVESSASPAPVRGFRRFRPTPRPAPAPEPVADTAPASFTATPASRPGVAWTGEIKGRSAMPSAAPGAASPATENVVPEPLTEPATSAVAPEPPSTAPAPIPEPTPPIEPQPAPAAPPPPVYDEDAAMRAIEGGWSRVGARAMSDTPELSDMGAAVAAATTAVEQVLAKAGIDADAAGRGARPKGLARPRNGAKDDLKQINGLGALDESTLNNLGIYHFDQIANWNDAQVLWMENHVFARGRLGREDWQRQARDLAASSAA
jgi:NADH-quinone oxidoreductase subunit E